ncbi:hypothetical protein NQZ68_023675, partial [Dissostichus eleginoides]
SAYETNLPTSTWMMVFLSWTSSSRASAGPPAAGRQLDLQLVLLTFGENIRSIPM